MFSHVFVAVLFYSQVPNLLLVIIAISAPTDLQLLSMSISDLTKLIRVSMYLFLNGSLH